jgi:hypothetical protein
MRQMVNRLDVVRLEGDTHLTLQWLTIWAERLWCFETHQSWLALDIPLPTHHQNGPAMPHQEAIARIDVVRRRQRRQA